MPPFAGVGVNIGLLDALHLTECLNSPAFGSLAVTIQAYERQNVRLRAPDAGRNGSSRA